MDSLVSIIIPTYNRAHLIIETLDSIIGQTYKNWECIIIDDGSTDNTNEVVGVYITKDSRFQYHHRPLDRLKGANACRNYGFEISRGEYIQWFDDDDVMLEDFLQEKESLFVSGINLVISSGYFVDETLCQRKKMVMDDEFELFKGYTLWKQYIITNSVLFRKSFLKDKDLFSLRISRGQEAELFSRLFFQLPKRSYQIINLPLFLYRQHSETKTSKNNEYIKSYKESESFISVENLKKSILIKDFDLIQFNYTRLVFFLFKGMENKHFNNSRYILNSLIRILSKINKQLSLELFFLGNLLLLLKKRSYRIEKRFRIYKIL